MKTEDALIIENEPLAKHTSWRIGGPARYYAEPRDVDALCEALAWARERAVPVFTLGGGSNLLVRDNGFNGLVLRYRAQSWRVEQDGPRDAVMFHVAAGAPMAGTARRVGGMGLAGLEWAEGVPGTIGGAVYGNAGCYGGDIAGILVQATVLVGDEVETWPVERMGYGYRSSVLKEQGLRTEDRRQGTLGEGCTLAQSPVVLDATLRLSQGDAQELAATMARIAAERKGKTPWGSSCGSVFRNPPGFSAGTLIEQAGLKGTRSGAAMISERHGNYIVNMGGASSDDILRLIEHARSEVMRQFGVELELEVVVVGE